MDVLLRSVTKSQINRNLAIVVIFWIVFLGLSFQKGEAVGYDNEQIVSLNNNSPENNLRGIEFSYPTLLDTGEPDAYGYQWDDSVAYSWKDPAGAVPVALSSPDDGFAGPIELGFVFPFYENTYSQVYISANGYISFLSLKGTSGYAANKEIPNDIAPNDFIAPFWSDLAVGGGYNSGVVSTMQDVNGQFFVVNYVGVSKRLSPSDLLTFQIILYQNGDVWFQYNSVAGNLDSSVGIEDGDGLDGLGYPNAVQNSLAIRFQRPGDTARVKILSAFQSRFTESGIANYFVQIRNTGELGSDTYNLTTLDEASGNPGWLITLWKEDGSGGLTDTNGDFIVDTGELAQGATKTILIRIQTPSAPEIGDYSSFLITVTSLLDSGKTADATFQAAIPAGHFIAFGNSAGLDLGRVNGGQQLSFDITDFGGNPALLQTGNQYVYAWEDADFNPGIDIEYAVLGYSGHAIQPATKLTNNATATYQTRDSSPALALSPNNRIGVVWVRQLFDPGPPLRGDNYNVYFAILDTNGNVLVDPINLTNNGPCDPPEPETCWQIGDDIDVPVFSSPTILATSDNRFVITWIDSRILNSGNVTDIGYVAYDTNGNALMLTTDDLKNGFADGDLYGEPRLLELPNQRMLITYSVFNPSSQAYTPAFEVYEIVPGPDTIGDSLQQDVLLTGANGRNPDSVILANFKILVAWTNTITNQIECGILGDDGATVTFDNQFIQLQNPDFRESNFVSVTATEDGLGILSWVDAEGGNRVYYALIDSTGAVITPPIIAWMDNQTIKVSRTGQGIAPIPDWHVFMPIISR